MYRAEFMEFVLLAKVLLVAKSAPRYTIIQTQNDFTTTIELLCIYTCMIKRITKFCIIYQY